MAKPIPKRPRLKRPGSHAQMKKVPAAIAPSIPNIFIAVIGNMLKIWQVLGVRVLTRKLSKLLPAMSPNISILYSFCNYSSGR